MNKNTLKLEGKLPWGAGQRPVRNAWPSPVLRAIQTFSGLALLGLFGGCAAKGDSGPPPPIITMPTGLDIPCDPNQVLKDVCQKCHTVPQRNGAPFPLVTYDDTQAIWKGAPIYTYMIAALEKGIMPLPPVTITPAQLDTLLTWLRGGTPARTPSDVCSQPPPDPADGAADGDVDAGSPGGPNDATADESEAASVDPDGGPAIADGMPDHVCDAHHDATPIEDGSDGCVAEDADDAACE
jgi:hypothetical protein